jgi:hypothetical protein
MASRRRSDNVGVTDEGCYQGGKTIVGGGLIGTVILPLNVSGAKWSNGGGNIN